MQPRQPDSERVTATRSLPPCIGEFAVVLNGNRDDGCERLGRRNPARRRHASPAATDDGRRDGAARLLPGAFESEPAPPLPRLSEPEAAARRVAARAGLGRARCPRSVRSRTRTGSGSSRSATTFVCAIPPWRSPPSPSRTRSRAEGSGRGCSSGSQLALHGGDRAVRRRGAPREPVDAGCLRAGGL